MTFENVCFIGEGAKSLLRIIFKVPRQGFAEEILLHAQHPSGVCNSTNLLDNGDDEDLPHWLDSRHHISPESLLGQGQDPIVMLYQLEFEMPDLQEEFMS